MFQTLPRESEWISWLFVALWTLIIYVTIPLARSIQEFIVGIWGRESFTYIVFACIILAGITTARYLVRRKVASWSNWLWLILVAVVFAHYTYRLSRVAPEEALHFVEYGILGLLLYRALSHRTRNYSIYICATLLGAIIGIIDETIQWLVPKRYWGYHDIWINFVAVALIQIGIAAGIRPAIVSQAPQLKDLRLITRLSMLLLILLTASVANTPDLVAWYSGKTPWLSFLSQNESTMSEYGFLYCDADIGTFRSRLSPTELQLQDGKRARHAAAILDRYHERLKYSEFLKAYTPHTDPFVHEARVHLFRRDRYLALAAKEKEDENLSRTYLDVAYREHLIMVKYFPQTLQRSTYTLPSEVVEKLASQHLAGQTYDSPVSKHLITWFSQSQLLTLLLIGLLGLILLERLLTRRNNAIFKNDRI